MFYQMFAPLGLLLIGYVLPNVRPAGAVVNWLYSVFYQMSAPLGLLLIGYILFSTKCSPRWGCC
jgi:hypothetical protein